MTNSERMALTKTKLAEAMALMDWRGGVMPAEAIDPRTVVKLAKSKDGKFTNVDLVAVEPVFSNTPCKIAPHHGKGIIRWEIWVHPDWIERVLEPGLACFPDQNLLVLDAVRLSPDRQHEGWDAAYTLVVATTTKGAMGADTSAYVGVTHAYCAVVIGGVAGAAQGSLDLAATRAIDKWQKAIGIDSPVTSVRRP